MMLAPAFGLLVVILRDQRGHGLHQFPGEGSAIGGGRESHLAVHRERRELLLGPVGAGDQVTDIADKLRGQRQQPAGRETVRGPGRIGGHRRPDYPFGHVPLGTLPHQLPQSVTLQRPQVVVDLLPRQADRGGEHGRRSRFGQLSQQTGPRRIQCGLRRGRIGDQCYIDRETSLPSDKFFCRETLFCRVVVNRGGHAVGGTRTTARHREGIPVRGSTAPPRSSYRKGLLGSRLRADRRCLGGGRGLGRILGSDDYPYDHQQERRDLASDRRDWASCAAFLERAARLTPDRARRAERTLATAEARLNVGDPGAAAALVEHAGPYPDDPLARARAKRLQGTARCVLGKPAEACPFLLDAAQALQSLHPQLAWDALLEAFEAALAAGRFARGAGTAEVLHAVRTAPRPQDENPSAAGLALDGFAALDKHEDKAGIARLRQAIALAAAQQVLDSEHLRFAFIAPMAAYELLDDSALHVSCARALAQARSHGSPAAVALTLGLLSYSEALAGRFAAAEAANAEARELAAATGVAADLRAGVSELAVLAWRGREAAVRSLAPARLREATQAGYGFVIGFTAIALTVLELGVGDYQAALRHALNASGEGMPAEIELLPELIEAAARCGAAGDAASALDKFTVRAQAAETDWALGMLLRSRALLAQDEDAEELYRR